MTMWLQTRHVSLWLLFIYCRWLCGSRSDMLGYYYYSSIVWVYDYCSSTVDYYAAPNQTCEFITIVHLLYMTIWLQTRHVSLLLLFIYCGWLCGSRPAKLGYYYYSSIVDNYMRLKVRLSLRLLFIYCRWLCGSTPDMILTSAYQTVWTYWIWALDFSTFYLDFYYLSGFVLPLCVHFCYYCTFVNHILLSVSLFLFNFHW